MSENKKSELIRICYDNSGSYVGHAVMELIELLQDESRRKNDESEATEVYRTQGEIRAYKNLLTYFTKKMPDKVKTG